MLGEPSTILIAKTFENPQLLGEARKSFRNLLMVANQLFGRTASDFDGITLFGADGRPLVEGSSGFNRVAFDVSGVNQELMELLK